MKKFLRPTGASVRQVEPEPAAEEDYAEEALRVAEQQKRSRTAAATSKYQSTRHVSPTTNTVERANSQAEPSVTDRRGSLAPETLSTLMTLRHNKSLWPSETVTQEILDSDEFRDPEVEPDSEEDEDDDA